jgi:hypothetical protein
METDDAPMQTANGTIRIRAEFDQSCWYEHKRAKILTTAEVAIMLLEELLGVASRFKA